MTDLSFITGIILSQIKYKEYDAIYTVFTLEKGKLSLFVRSARKMNSKLRAFLHLGAILNIDIISKNQGMPIIKSIKSIYIPEIQKYEDLILFEKILELTDKFCKKEHHLPAVFSILSNLIPMFCYSEKKEQLEFAYEIKLLTKLGFLSQLNICSICHQKLESKDQYFDDTKGFICNSCNKSSLKKINFEQIKILSFLQSSNYENIIKLILSEEQIYEIKNIILLIMRHHILIPLKTEK